MIKAFCKPRIKVGTEWVTKGQPSKFLQKSRFHDFFKNQVRHVSRQLELLVELPEQSLTASSSG